MKNRSTLGAISMNKYPRVHFYSEVNAATWRGAVSREEEGPPYPGGSSSPSLNSTSVRVTQLHPNKLELLQHSNIPVIHLRARLLRARVHDYGTAGISYTPHSNTGGRLLLLKTGLLPNDKLPILKMSNLTDFDDHIDF